MSGGRGVVGGGGEGRGGLGAVETESIMEGVRAN